MSVPALPSPSTSTAERPLTAETAQPPGTARPTQPRGSSSTPTSAPAAPTPATPLAPRGPTTTEGTAFAAAAPSPVAVQALATPGPGQVQVATGLSDLESSEPFTMLGDMSPLTVLQRLRATPLQGPPQPFPPHPIPKPPVGRRVPAALSPTVRGFKIAENQSPKPQDRVYFSFYYFDDLNAALNRQIGSPLADMRAYRYIFGLEKTFDEGRGSIGFQLPLDNLTARSTLSGLDNSSTSLNNLTVFSKYVLKYNPETGSLISAGLAVTPRTGPLNFAGATYFRGVNDTTVQPFVGYLWRRERFYLHGFVALDVPTSVRDVTMVYNDVGIGYYAYLNSDPGALLTGLVPTFELHVDDPLTHGDYTNLFDPTGTPDVVNLTYGINAMVGQNGVCTFGVVTPVTGPHPFSYELVVLLNWRFGRTRGLTAPPPIAGG